MEDEEPQPSPYVQRPSVGLWMLWGIPLGFFIIFFVSWLWIRPDLNNNEAAKSTTTCLNNLRELARGFQMYAADNNGILPGPLPQGSPNRQSPIDNRKSLGWSDQIRPLLAKVPDEDLLFACPVQRRIDPESSGYELNGEAAGQELSNLGPPNQLVLIFDSKNVERNAIGPTSDMPSLGRHEHGRKNNLVYADGSAKTVDAK